MSSAHEGSGWDRGVRALAIAGTVAATLFITQPSLAADEASGDAGAGEPDVAPEPEAPSTSDVSSPLPSSETPKSAAPVAPPSETPPAEAVAPSSATSPPAESPAAQPPTETAAPSRVLARSGVWLASVDDALPLFGLGAASSLSTLSALRIGDPGGSPHPSPPRAVAIDLVVSERLTLGLSPVFEQSVSSKAPGSIHIGGVAVRAGYVFSLGDRVFLWPRAGLTHLRGLDDDTSFEHRTDVVVDARIGWTPRATWALTVGPSVALPISHGAASKALAGAAHALTSEDPFPRVALSAGLTVPLGDGYDSATNAASAKGGQPRFLLGVERVVPLVRFRSEQGANMTFIDIGTADTTSRFPVKPRVAFDFVVSERVTVGAAANAGYVRISSTSFVPGNGPDAFVVELAPRLGGFFRASKHFAFWPRAGVTWERVSASRPDFGGRVSHQLGADLDAFVVAFVTRDVGITIGPSITLPLAGSGRGYASFGAPVYGYGAPRVVETKEYSFFSAAVSAGIVLMF